eukprot:3870377-Amphidinium_carterae.1
MTCGTGLDCQHHLLRSVGRVLSLSRYELNPSPTLLYKGRRVTTPKLLESGRPERNVRIGKKLCMLEILIPVLSGSRGMLPPKPFWGLPTNVADSEGGSFNLHLIKVSKASSLEVIFIGD